MYYSLQSLFMSMGVLLLCVATMFAMVSCEVVCCWLRSKCGIFDKHRLHIALRGSTLCSLALAKTIVLVSFIF